MSLSKITENVSHWIDMMAETAIAAIGRFQPARRIKFIEEDGDIFSVRHEGPEVKSNSAISSVRLLDGNEPATPKPELAAIIQGGEVEIVLRPRHFLIRSLELPKRAGEFLDGIVRSQIDRLTPWSATDAAFGWTHPVAIPDDRISLTVVATARARIEPYVDRFTGFGARSIAVSMRPEEGEGDVAPVRIFLQGSQGTLGVARVRHWLMMVLAAVSVTTAIAATAAQFVGADLEGQTQDMNRRIAERRATLIKSRNATGGSGTAQHALERRKQESAASVIVLEALSQVLPDHTYVTELRVEGDRVQIIGVTQEAPSLIRLMEESPHFTRATFFAPTTRSPGDPGERFHVEARIKPVFTASQ